MVDPIAVDNEIEKRLTLALPGFDIAGLMLFVQSIFKMCNPDDTPPATAVEKIKGMTLMQRNGAVNRRIDVLMEDDDMKLKDARKQAKTEVAALIKVAKEASEDERLAAAERVLKVQNPTVDLF